MKTIASKSPFFIICIIFIASAPLFAQEASLAEEKEIKNVLVVNSYHSGYEWSDSIMKGIQSVLGDKNFNVYIEYLDSKRYDDEIYYKYLEEIIRYKYSDAKIEAMIVSDHHAFNLMLGMRKTFQTDVPLIYCGIDKTDPEELAVYKPIYGVNEGDSGIRSTLDLILSVHPGIRKIFFVADQTTSAGVMLSYAREYEPLYKEVTFDYLVNMSAGELKAALKNVPQNSAVFWLHFIKDKNGKVFSLTESQTYVANNASVPVYVCYGFSEGTGIAGGSIIRGFDQGEQAAQIARELLSQNILPDPFYKESTFANMFDYKVIKNFNIGIKDIPEDSIIYNKPFAGFEKYRWQIIGIIIFIVFQTLLISSLMITLKKRKAGEKSLRESEERFRATFEQAAVGISHVSPDGHFLRINQKFCDIVGYSREEMKTKTFQEITYHEDLEADLEHVNQLLSGKSDAYAMEKRHIRKDGELVWVLLTVSLVRDNTGLPRWFVSVVKDIGDRKQAEDNLKQLRDYTDHLIETANVMIVGLNTDGRVTHFNPAAETITGYSLAEVRERDWFELLVPRDRYPEVHDEFDRLVQGGIPHVYENPIVTKSGQERIISWRNSEIIRNKEVVGTTSFGMDITKRKQAEQSLKESEEEFRNLIEQSPISIQVLNPDGRISRVNKAFQKLWGVSDADLPGVLEKYNILEDEEAEKLGVLPLIKKTFAGEAVVLPIIEYDAPVTMKILNLEHITSKKRWIRARFYPVKNPAGEIINIVNLEEDMTEQMQAEEKVKHYQQRLRALASQLTLAEEQERRRIATDLHDNIGQSLAFARLRMASAQKTTSRTKLARILEEISVSILQSIKDTRNLILDLSSPSMNEIGISAAISEWLAEQIQKRHGLETEFIDECGKVPLDDNIRAILFRSVRELLANVIKHAQAKKVTVSMKTVDTNLNIIVQDDGVGLDYAKESSKIGHFGLFSIRERMSDLGGSMEIVSGPGKGTKAVLNVPLNT